MKMQRGYDPNTRHVMYGLDADLVMLALVSHDPHFSLLREVVDFNSFRRKENSTKELKKQIYHDAWQLLHISTLREYLDLEFSNVKFEGFKYDLERVIDDVILPSETQKRVCRSLKMLKNKHLQNPWRKHGNIPL